MRLPWGKYWATDHGRFGSFIILSHYFRIRRMMMYFCPVCTQRGTEITQDSVDFQDGTVNWKVWLTAYIWTHVAQRPKCKLIDRDGSINKRVEFYLVNQNIHWKEETSCNSSINKLPQSEQYKRNYELQSHYQVFYMTLFSETNTHRHTHTDRHTHTLFPF